MTTSLQTRLRRLGRRVLVVGVGAGVGWGLVVAALWLLTCVWLDLLWDLPPELRLGSLFAGLILGLSLVAATAWRARRRGAPLALARRMDQVGGCRGQVLTGTDLALEAGPRQGMSAGLADMAVRKAEQLAGAVAGRDVVPGRPAYLSFGGVALLASLIVLGAAGMPRLALTEWLRFLDSYGDHPPFSRVAFDVKPGDVRVVYGSGVDVRVTTEGAPIERLDLILYSEGAAAPEILPMFPEPGGAWRASVTSVTAPGRYLVRCHAGRSQQFRLDVLTVPRLEGVRFRITPPVYTNRPAYEGPLPQGGIVGLPGTRVELWARSNRPLSSGRLEFSAPNQEKPEAVRLAPAEAQEVAGSFQVRVPGQIRLRVTDTEGQTSAEAFSASVLVLKDEPPAVRLIEPRSFSFATPSALLPVALDAEDDYGISRLQVFRSLNDSRALAQDLSVPVPPAPRCSGRLVLRLAEYGLEPGDEIKLFGRVEDNDPSGPNGAESAVAVVRIISESEFERLTRSRAGMQQFLSKYRQAQRRVAKMADEVELLRKKAKEQDQGAQALRKELEDLARRLQAEADAMHALAKRPLPYDLDKALARHLEESTRRLRRLSDRSEELSRSKMSGRDLADALEPMFQELEGQRSELEREAVEPLEELATVLALLQDAAQFRTLAARQRSLEQRLRSLKGRERPDDQATKTRMRDLQREQQEIRADLEQLIEDLVEHAARLPEVPAMEEFKKEVEAFAQKLRGSRAIEAMGECETALAELSGTRGHAAALRAAEILEKLAPSLEGAQGLSGRGRGALRFCLALRNGLGDTIAQMLADMGLPSGQAQGQGQGGGGQSSRRHTADNVGLYGGLPVVDGLDDRAASAGNRAAQGRGPGRLGIGPAGPMLPGQAAPPAGAGSGEGAVPLSYRLRVAEYFRRVADETGNR